MLSGLGPARKRELLIFGGISAAVFLCLLFFIAFFASREAARRRLDLEYRAFQISTSLMEYFLMRSASSDELPPGVRSYGIYDQEGKALRRSPLAPGRIDAGKESDSLWISSGTIKLLRRLGRPEMGRMWRFRSPQAAEGAMDGNPSLPGKALPGREGATLEGIPPPGLGQGAGRGDFLRRGGSILFIEIPDGDYRRRELFFNLGALVLALGLFGLYLLLIRLYGRTLILSDREERSRELIQLGEAARTLAHEIKNPLSIIKIQCDTLDRLLPPERKRNLAIILDETGRLAALSDKVGDFLRSGRGHAEPLDLGAWALEFAERNSLPPPRALPGLMVFIDPSRLESIAGNLLKNAREAGGPIEGIELRLGGAPLWARLELLDRGPGIEPNTAADIFKPFFSTKAGGSGIGLALASKFASEAGGSLEYRSRSGGGSLFRLNLPRKR